MKKKIAFGIITLTLLCILTLGIHIYVVTRPKAPDAHTIVMARIDIKQPITQQDAGKITQWLSGQNGVAHVLCNPQSDCVVFTFFPVKVNANQLVADFKSTFHLKAERFVPRAEDLKGSCPVMSASYTYKIYNFFKSI